MAPAPGVGGAGHVRVTSRGIVVVIGNNGFVYDRDGNQLSTWTVEEGRDTVLLATAGHRDSRHLAVLDVTESRVSQLHGQAVRSLRLKLKKRLGSQVAALKALTCGAARFESRLHPPPHRAR